VVHTDEWKGYNGLPRMGQVEVSRRTCRSGRPYMADEWKPYIDRYRGGEWRDGIFRDMVLEDARGLGRDPTLLDIGCGRGLDGSVPLQRSLAEAAGRFIGVEPDPEIVLGDYFAEALRCPFEDVPLPSGSVHLAFAVMVLEHLESPQRFWDKLWDVLVDGGIFWGMTVDARHPFCKASLWAERQRFKNIYLRLMCGRRGVERYENYPVFYRSNTPEALTRYAARFSRVETINFSRVGQWSVCFPRPFRPFVDALDRRAVRQGRPGTLLMIRATK
jgi:SAM-dependent methyltransferase